MINWKAPYTHVAFGLLQQLLPQHALSRIAHRFTRCTCSHIVQPVIKLFVSVFKIDTTLAADPDLRNYSSINAFFTRALRPGVRPIDPNPNTIVSPADGAISECGPILHNQVLQAKGQNYTLEALLGGDSARVRQFEDGNFATIYLSPKDYHRLHMPLAGKLQEMVHVPGKLFSVNQATANSIPGLFARNERVIAYFDTQAGPVALILVGAIFVASIETVWHGEVTPPTRTDIQRWQYTDNQQITLAKGEEMGRFNMGSTIILLFGKGKINWNDDLTAGNKVVMGESVGRLSD